MNCRTGPSGLSRLFLVLEFAIAGLMSIAAVQAQELCGGTGYPFPYTDVSGVGPAFCPGIMEAYVTGISKGTSPTTFSPNDNVSRLQMTTFLQRSLDQALARASRRAALNQWWTQQNTNLIQTISFPGNPIACAADGAAIWTSNFDGQVMQVQANTGAVLGIWSGAFDGAGVLAVNGNVFVAGQAVPGDLYVLDSTQPPGAVVLAASNLGNNPAGIAYDGVNLWTANSGPTGSVSIIAPTATAPYPPGNVTTVTTGFNQPLGILFDGAHIWVTDTAAGTLLKLDAGGAVLQTVTVGAQPKSPAFDGANIWVPNAADSSITVVQASTGNVVATINSDGTNLLNEPEAASFDGERILVTNLIGLSVTVFKAADLSVIANVSTGTAKPFEACSDGANFWITLVFANGLLRF